VGGPVDRRPACHALAACFPVHGGRRACARRPVRRREDHGTHGELEKPIDDILYAYVGGQPAGAFLTRLGLGRVLEVLRASPLPLRVIVRNPVITRKLQRLLHDNPGVRATIVVLPALRTSTDEHAVDFPQP
jgi:hypothetical protein